MEDEEPDYMSDQLLVTCSDQDHRPGLIHNRAKQREHEVIKRRIENEDQQQRNKKTKINANERLQEGLQQPIGPENKGFSMLAKMGFKPGTSLGSTQSGLLEPIGINVKTDRKGLGRDQAIKQLQIRKREIREKTKTINVEDYRAQLSKKYRERDIMADLLKSEKTCKRFDSECGIEVPEEPWFWPQPDETEEDQEEEETEEYLFSTSEKLEMLTMYLRGTYQYCIWCGVEYQDQDDMSMSCPGPSRDLH